MIDKQKYLDKLKEQLCQGKNLSQINELKNIFIKQEISPLYKEITNVENKKEYGLMLNSLKNEIEVVYNNFVNSFKDATDKVPFLPDYTLKNQFLNNGHHHILTIVLNEIIEFLKQLNFEIVSGNEIVTDEFNFVNLNIPKNHPARNNHDSLFINQDYLLRTHCTVTTAEKIYKNNNPDIRIASYGNVYRKDDDDATHSHQFMQLDIVWINEKLNVANLKWLIDSFLKYLFHDENIKTRYRLSYFPFTEPSFEVDLSCFKCNQKGCNICKNTGWIEILGAGLLNPHVLELSKIKGKVGLAAGIGIERIAMLKYGINDIRDLYTNNFEFNRQFRK